MNLRNNEIKCYKLIFCIGLALIFFGVGFYFSANLIIRNQINKNLVLKNSSEALGFFKNPPAKILRKYYIFDVKNPKEVERGRSKPKLVQRGPYTYSVRIQKTNIKFKDRNTLDYDPVVTLYFEPNLSNGNESDMITFLNVPLLSMVQGVMKDRTDYSQMGVNTLIKILDVKLFLTKSVGQLIKGYDDPLMKLAKNFVPNVKEAQFSLINGRNGTNWQRFSINTGHDDIKQIGKIISWNNLTKLDYWSDEYSNRINGSDGTIFSPFLTRDKTLYAFSPDICRSYSLQYLKDNILDGIRTMEFSLPKNFFYNSTLNPDNQGFVNDFLGNGVLSMSKCMGGGPGYISLPHFLNADEKFLKGVIGMEPNSTLHDFALQFEPNLGVALHGNARLQLNFYIKNYKSINIMKNVKPCLIPFVWFDEEFKTNPEIIIKFSQIHQIIEFNFISFIILLFTGFLMTLLSYLRLCSLKKDKKQTKKKIKENEEDKNLILRI